MADLKRLNRIIFDLPLAQVLGRRFILQSRSSRCHLSQRPPVSSATLINSRFSKDPYEALWNSRN